MASNATTQATWIVHPSCRTLTKQTRRVRFLREMARLDAKRRELRSRLSVKKLVRSIKDSCKRELDRAFAKDPRLASFRAMDPATIAEGINETLQKFAKELAAEPICTPHDIQVNMTYTPDWQIGPIAITVQDWP